MDRRLVNSGLLALVMVGAMLRIAHSHTLPISYLTLVPGSNYLHLELTLNPFELSFFAELDRNRNGRLDPTEWEDQQVEVTRRLLGCLELWVDERPLAPEVSGMTPDLDSHHATLRAHYPLAGRPGQFSVQSRLPDLTSGSHFTQVTFGQGGAAQTAVLDSRSAIARFAVAATNAAAGPPTEAPKAASPSDETLRLALPVIITLVFCVLGWYGRSQQRKRIRLIDDDRPASDKPDLSKGP